MTGTVQGQRKTSLPSNILGWRHAAMLFVLAMANTSILLIALHTINNIQANGPTLIAPKNQFVLQMVGVGLFFLVSTSLLIGLAGALIYRSNSDKPTRRILPPGDEFRAWADGHPTKAVLLSLAFWYIWLDLVILRLLQPGRKESMRKSGTEAALFARVLWHGCWQSLGGLCLLPTRAWNAIVGHRDPSEYMGQFQMPTPETATDTTVEWSPPKWVWYPTLAILVWASVAVSGIFFEAQIARPVERGAAALSNSIIHSLWGVGAVGVMCTVLLVSVSLFAHAHYKTLRWYRVAMRTAIVTLSLFALWGWTVAIPLLVSIQSQAS